MGEFSQSDPSGRSADELSWALDELRRSSRPVFDAPGSVQEQAGACPDPDEWIQLALGAAPSALADKLFSHAADCAPCASRLRQSLRMLQEEPTEEESAEFFSPGAETPAWQRSLAAELAGTPRRPARKSMPQWALWAGAVAACLLLAVSGGYLWQRQHSPERLMAQAYTQQRGFEFRVPGAQYASVSPGAHLRGGASGQDSALLLDAHARIEQKLEHAPEDAHWLQLKARASVLEEHYDVAIDILDRLIAAGPVTPTLLADAATAYYQRGAATGSENDRAMALDYLRRADELRPDDPVILFNEAIALEDRGQVMNAVETWGRFLNFERDPQWRAEGQRRMAGLEEKLKRLKTHQSRMEEKLATPEAMLALARDRKALAAYGEELLSHWFPELLRAAYVLPVDRSRGSPNVDRTLAARQLLKALAESMQNDHQDPWLARFLSSPPSNQGFLQAAGHLAEGDAALRDGRFQQAIRELDEGRKGFLALGSRAGADRAQIDLAFANHRTGKGSQECYRYAHDLVGRDPEFINIQLFAKMQATLCDTTPGVDAEEHRPFEGYRREALAHGFDLLAMRAGNLVALPASDNGDVERAWRIYLSVLREFWAGDYPAYRLMTTLSGLADTEARTPRTRSALLVERESFQAVELSPIARQQLPAERILLAYAAMRAGAVRMAQEQLERLQGDIAASPEKDSALSGLFDAQLRLARIYTERHEFEQARHNINAFLHFHRNGLEGYLRRKAGVAEGEWELASGRPGDGEALLQEAILEEEQDARQGDAQFIAWARQERESYAVEAGLWQARHRNPEEALALWERYRLRILDRPAPLCAERRLDCLRPKIRTALSQLGEHRVIGQIVLADRTLIYEGDAHGLHWTTVAIGERELLDAAGQLERAVNSPRSSQASVDQAARRVGRMLFGHLYKPLRPGEFLLLEPDPLLGNLPWPAVVVDGAPLGLRYDLAETPSLALGSEHTAPRRFAGSAPGALVVGASIGAGEAAALPEVLDEARTVARMAPRSHVLLARQATADGVIAQLGAAPAIHFAGHAASYASGARLLLAPEQGAEVKPAYLDSKLLRRHPPRAARLVVFSACSSGRREAGWNTGVGDIVDTLGGLGVPEVVATRWRIDSYSAVTLMDSFYKELAQGSTAAHALAVARRALAADGRYQHPYYWAAYYNSTTGPAKLNDLFHPAG